MAEFFNPHNPHSNAHTNSLYARYELAHTLVDFLAATLFLIGSILFFWSDTQFSATWLFVIGSFCFAVKPSLRLIREYHLYRLGKVDDLAQREMEEMFGTGHNREAKHDMD